MTRSGDKANHITAYGPTSVAAFGESWDFTDLADVGQERFALAVEPQIADATTANLRASLGLAREQRFALLVKATLQPNPALELLDVVTFNDVVGNVTTRITELHTTWFPLQGHHDLVMVGEGV